MNTESTMLLHDQILSLYDANYNPLKTNQKNENKETINSENNEDEDFFNTVQGMEDASASSKNISRNNNDIISEEEQSESDISSDDSADKDLQKSPVKDTYSPSESSDESVESKRNNEEKMDDALHKSTNNLSDTHLNKEDANRKDVPNMIMTKKLSVDGNEDNPKFEENCNMSSNPRKKKRTLTSSNEKSEVAHEQRKESVGTSKEDVIECQNEGNLEEEEFEKHQHLEIITIDMDKNLPKKKSRPVPIKRKMSKEVIEKNRLLHNPRRQHLRRRKLQAVKRMTNTRV